VPRLVLMVRCAGCGHEFDTGIRMDARNFARATFAANYHVCPACGRRGTFGKADYRPVVPEAPARGMKKDRPCA
jgi:rubredoxin